MTMKRNQSTNQNYNVQDKDLNLQILIKVVAMITVKKVIGAIREDDGKSNYMFFLGTLRFFGTLKINILEFNLSYEQIQTILGSR